jgi:hypothetical protein
MRRVCNTSIHLIVAAATVTASGGEEDLVLIGAVMVSNVCNEEKRLWCVHSEVVGCSRKVRI